MPPQEKSRVGDVDSFTVRGGLKTLGEAMERGMVLVMSLWDDHDVGMVWLDSNDPPNESPSKPGRLRNAVGSRSMRQMQFKADDSQQTTCKVHTALYPDCKFASHVANLLNGILVHTGVARGTCPIDSGNPATVESQHPEATVRYGNIKIGDIGSTNPLTPPTPSGCPGGSLSACIALCPSSPPAAFQACVQTCTARCT